MSNPDSREAVLAHKKQVKDTWEEMEALAAETNALLTTCVVKGNKSSKKSNMKTGNAKDHFDATKTKPKKESMDDIHMKTMGTSGSGAGKGSGKGKGEGGKNSASSLQMSGSMSTSKLSQQQNAKTGKLAMSLDGPLFDKTKDLYAESLGRVTVEVLDDASPDVTPRGEEEEKKRSDRMKELAETSQLLSNMEKSESIYRKSEFGQEKHRILANSDVFVSAPGVTAADVERERFRLQKLEEAARKKKVKHEKETHNRTADLHQLRASVLIQKTYRGHLGRRKYRLSARLKQLADKEGRSTELVWIEVRDRESGDVWYYNKSTGLSQWEKPDDMFSVLAPKENIKVVPGNAHSGAKYKGEGESKSDKLKVTMTLPSHEASRRGKAALTLDEKKAAKSADDSKQEAARDEVSKLIGTDKLRPKDNLFAPDGSFKPQLRTTVLDALLQTRFDSVSSVLSDQRWLEGNTNPFAKPPPKKVSANPPDMSRKGMVAVMKLGQEDKSKQITIRKDSELDREALTVGKISAPGLTEVEDQDTSGPFVPGTMCFGCWSSGAKRKCALHVDPEGKLKPSETMLLCRNWELGVMRRRYRSEEIQEIFMKKGSSLRYDVKRKAFLTVVEQRHQIYRGLKSLIDLFNFRMLLWSKIKRWLNSLADEVRSKPVSKQSKERVAMMRMRRTLVHAFQLTNLLAEVTPNLPQPPITGTSWPERISEIQFLFKRADQASGQEVELIMAYPTPPNKTLYIPRVYHITLPKSIPMPKPAYIADKIKTVLPHNNYMAEDSKGNWFEKMVRAISASVVFDAQDQVLTITPTAGKELIKRSKQPPPATIKFASRGQKSVPGNLAVGGLPLELLVYQLISTYVPAQYGGLVVMDKSTVSPGVSPEVLIQFQSLLQAPINQEYILRALEHPLNYRRAPTITANSAVEPDNKYYYGRNRADQTGEQEPHGFRTTCWAKYVVVSDRLDPAAFTPGPEVVSLNNPGANVSVTTHADHTYPFCEPSTRDNSTLDFFHLLLQGAISGSKAQVFTALTVQEAGLFLKECNAELPMGHLVVSVYRSWAFTQKDTIEEFKTDDGVSYWYHRRTGQTFWERPLYEEEEKTALEGGTILDMDHPEEPLNVHKGFEGADRRYTQGDFRKLMLAHHEQDSEAEKRRSTAHVAGRVARDRGLLPDLPEDARRALEAQMMDNTSHVGDAGGGVSLAETALGVQFPNAGNSSMVAHQKSVNSTGSRAGSPARQAQPPPAGGRLGSALDENSMFADNGSQVLGSPSKQGGGSQVVGRPGVKNQAAFVHNPQIALPGMPGLAVAGIPQDMMSGLAGVMQEMMKKLSSIGSTGGNPQDMLQLGMGMGMALLGSGAVQGMTTVEKLQNKDSNSYKSKTDRSQSQSTLDGKDAAPEDSGLFPSIAEEDMEHINRSNMEHQSMVSEARAAGKTLPLPIGTADPTLKFSTNKDMDREERNKLVADKRKQLEDPLTALEYARGLRVEQDVTETPDVVPEKVLTVVLPKNAEAGARERNVPCMVYPELSTMVHPDGPPRVISEHDAAGLGTSFVGPEDADTQQKVKGSDILRKTVVPLPVGFFNAIIATHIAKQDVDYLPMVPNLPQARTVGRVKPRSSAIDWLAISFDPWSAGKPPLNQEFVPSLAAKAEGLFGKDAASSQDALDKMRDTTSDAFMTTDDKEGQAEQRAVITKDQVLAADFEKVCSLCRHGKFSEVETLVNQPDWNVPIDYQNDMGNTLLHTVAQNGNRRLIKLCMRRGADLNQQNLTGQTALHFAFGYGYTEAGEYLVKKGANDSIKNKDGLTCYEGLGGHELSLL